MVVQQHPDAIDAGVFHNDVIAVANGDALLYHELAFAEGEAAVDAMERAFGHPIHRLRVSVQDATVEDAVSSYLFNSQLLTMPDGTMAIIAPMESQHNQRVHAVLSRFVQANDNPVGAVHYMDLRESMKNGGGPACLRLRVVLTQAQLAAMHQGVRFTPALHEQLAEWVERYYRESLAPDELADISLMDEANAAQQALLRIIGLEGKYHPASLTE